MERVDRAESHSGCKEGSETAEGIPTTREVLEEFYQLLEDYAPPWYTEQHHNRAVSALLGRRV